MTVLDASALLAVLFAEPGADVVLTEMVGTTVGAVNFAEVVGKLVDRAEDVGRLRTLLAAVNVTIEPVSAADADLAGAMRGLPRGRSLSLADRLCLALTVRTDPATVLTADRAWSSLGLPIAVRLIR